MTELANAELAKPRLYNTIATLTTEIVLEIAESAGLITMTDDLLVHVIDSGGTPTFKTFPVGEHFLGVAIVNRASERDLTGTVNMFLVQDLSVSDDPCRSAQVRFRVKDGFVIGQDDLRDVTESTVDERRRSQLVDALFEETNCGVTDD